MPHFLLQVGKQALTTAAYAAFVSAIAACSGPSSVAYSPTSFTGANVPNGVHRATAYSFKTLDNPDDPAFNELLAINNLGKVGGYYGNGSKKNPSVGYIVRDFGNSHYRTKHYPGAIDTVVTAVDNLNDIAGYYVSSSTGGTFGFIETVDGIWTSYKQPHTRGSYNITELLGLSDAGIGVGFYADANQHRHAFELIQTTGKFHGISPQGAVNAVATGINGKGDVVGYYNKSNGATESFLLKGGVYTRSSTRALKRHGLGASIGRTKSPATTSTVRETRTASCSTISWARPSGPRLSTTRGRPVRPSWRESRIITTWSGIMWTQPATPTAFWHRRKDNVANLAP